MPPLNEAETKRFEEIDNRVLTQREIDDTRDSLVLFLNLKTRKQS